MAKKKKIPFNRQKLFTLAGVIIIVILLLIFAVYYAYPKLRDQQRLERINTIFASLNLNVEKDYLPKESNVFGDKRVYDWDKSRSASSLRTYIHPKNVDETVKDIEAAVAKTEFTSYQDPYPGSVIWEHIYKSPKNEYLRITVSSKVRDDAFFNDYQMNKKLSDATFAIDPNTGPSTVMVRVNLDDNND